MYFNHKKFDFWKVYDRIKHFYPIGIRKDVSEFYNSYPGLKELEGIIIDNIHESECFQARWSSFTEKIEAEVGKEVIGTTYGQAPSFSSFVLLEKNTVGDFTRTKELHFLVSLVGPYYTIIGTDSNVLHLDERHYGTTNYLVVSPENEFKDIFNLLCNRIESHFHAYRYLPFELCRQTIDGLEVCYRDEHRNTIFHALFNDQIELTSCRTIGDTYYKSEDWIREDFVDDGGRWTAYPPE